MRFQAVIIHMIIITLMAGVVPCLIAQVPSDTAELLIKADDSLAPTDVKYRLRIENMKDGKIKNWSELDCWNQGADKFLMVYLAPPIQVGQAQLKISDTIFIYVKKADRITQISAKAAFFNSLFTHEDVMSARLSVLYDIKEVLQEKYDGKDVLVINLQGKTKDVAYGQIKLYLSADTKMPIRREYFSFSGQLIKVMTVDKVAHDINGLLQRIELTMQDAVRKNLSTKASILVTDRSPIPDNYFSRSYLKVVTQ